MDLQKYKGEGGGGGLNFSELLLFVLKKNFFYKPMTI